ncbi:HAD family hydrolase [Oceanobacillus piezotolerans]|uniref:HAD family hydrolase n=1 Tax=Oceanobacillus piezotolerans TaxID=2448030 RepID=A0A498DKF1_9BACI|nr:HAD family hydrolase [Oceanobacillus piezotolerans]RLL46962.1 HAD family hydrolase [Oceanobacillus piezotolerans]
MKTIIFDVDDTLYDQAMSFKNTCKRMFDRPFTEEELENFYIVSRKYSDALFDICEAGEMTVEEMHIRRIKDACDELGIAITRERALEFQHAYVEEQQKITLFPEVVELLDFLSETEIQLAVLTNGSEGHQSMKIKQLNLVNWIQDDYLFISESIGHIKPTLEAFQYLENKMGLNKEDTIYIGDSFANDIVGAKQAGWQAIWMNHRRREMPENTVKPDYEVHTAGELLALFKKDAVLVN